MHSSQHARDESVNAPTLFYERDQCRDTTFIIGGVPEVGEDNPLERFDLILKTHKIRDGFISVNECK